MGNCLVLEETVVRAMKTDCESLAYKSQTNKAMSKLSHMLPDAQMLQNHLQYLLPQPETMKKAVRFSDNYDVLEGGDQASGVVRIKLVVSKKELQEMLSRREVSVAGMTLKLLDQETTNKAESNDRDDEVISKGWFPALESIPEIN